jgi:CspA family cold shock protein
MCRSIVCAGQSRAARAAALNRQRIKGLVAEKDGKNGLEFRNFAVDGFAPVDPSSEIKHCNQPLAWACLAAILDRQPGDRSMARGTVKWFNSQKGYGFIQPQAGGKDVFVHISAVEKAGLSSLNEGQVVEYEEVPNKGKTSAENLKVQR